ncbi:MAG: DUF3108 domain-containing protein [Thermodesulfobacteriota bacterium]
MTRKKQRTGRWLLVMAAALALAVLPVLPLPAKRIPANQVRVSTPVYAPADSFQPLPGLYSYVVSWNGVPAASAALELDRRDGDYEIRASAQTAKGIDVVFKLRYQCATVLAADTFKPKYSFSVAETNSRQKTVRIEFLPDGEILSVRRDDEGNVKTLKFDPDNFTLDPYSAGLLALSQEWKVGDKRRFDLFNGKHRYLIEFVAVRKTSVTVNGKARPAFVLIPSIKKLTKAEADESDDSLRQARIFISADQPRQILKVTSELLFGRVDTEMVGFTPQRKVILKAPAPGDLPPAGVRK